MECWQQAGASFCRPGQASRYWKWWDVVWVLIQILHILTSGLLWKLPGFHPRLWGLLIRSSSTLPGYLRTAKLSLSGLSTSKAYLLDIPAEIDRPLIWEVNFGQRLWGHIDPVKGLPCPRLCGRKAWRSQHWSTCSILQWFFGSFAICLPLNIHKPRDKR